MAICPSAGFDFGKSSLGEICACRLSLVTPLQVFCRDVLHGSGEVWQQLPQLVFFRPTRVSL